MAKIKRVAEIVPAKDWQRRLAALQRMPAAERREFDEKRRLELSIEDLRDEIVGGVLGSIHGTDDESFAECYARGGPHPSTLRHWRDRKVLRPQAAKLRQAGMTIGWELKWVQS